MQTGASRRIVMKYCLSSISPLSPHCRKWKMHLSCNVTSSTKNAIEKYLHYHFGAVIVTFVIQDGVCSSSKMFCQSIKMEGAGRRV
ncbi:hypothetical protein PEC301899_22490 [Pectobacterium carotovorum subsp. carotovorum]|nr:hypothetical protein PEC301899_22490 [Pectobacterium carotovorum subsp. carotovorum]